MAGPPAPSEVVSGAWERWGEELVRFLRDLLAVESPPGAEKEAAERVRVEMERLGLDQVGIDRTGNVLGSVPGGGGGRLLLNAHIDVVSAGDPADWSHPPFGGEQADGRIYGRGACDTKASVAAQLYAAAALKEAEVRLDHDLMVAAVVMEEVGGIGTLGLLEDEGAPDRALVGEPSDGCLMIGHRGRIQFEVEMRGRAYHAAVAGAGVSPYPSLCRFLQAVKSLDLPRDEFYGASSLEPTILRSDNASPNVVPAGLHLVLDCRVLPGQDTEALEAEIRGALDASLEDGVSAEVVVPTVRWRTWMGVEKRLPHVMPSFGTDPSDPVVLEARRALEEVTGDRVDVRPWKFATDGGHLTAAGSRVVGWGPGLQARAHTVDEFISLGELRRGFEGTLAAVLGLDRAPS